MAMFATIFKACRFFLFFRQGWYVGPEEIGKAFYKDRGKSVRRSVSSPYSYPGRQGIFWFAQSFISPCKYTVIYNRSTNSVLGGPPWILLQQVPVAADKTRIHVGNFSEATYKSWSRCWCGLLRPSFSDFMGGSSFRKKSWLSTLSLPTMKRQDSAVSDGHSNTFEGLAQLDDLIVPPKPVPCNCMLEGFRTWSGAFRVRNCLKCRDPIVNLEASSHATRQQKSRGKACKAELAKRLTPSYVIHLLQRQKDPNLAFMFFKWAGRQSGFKHTSGTYCALIRALCRSEMFSSLKQVKKEIELKGLGSSTVLLSELAIYFSQGGLVQETIECLEQMEDLGCRPRLRLYNNLVNMLVKAGFSDRAHLLYRQMIDAGCLPDSCTFNNLLDGYGKSCDLVNLRRVLEEMKHQSCKPTRVTIAILLKVLCKAEKVDEAWNLFGAYKDSANVVVSNTMLHGLCRVGRTEEAVELFEQMKEKRQFLETATFNILIHGLGIASRTEEAIELFQSMLDCGVAPDVITYNVTLKILIKDGRVSQAHRLFQDMATKGLSPDVHTYATLIHGFCKKGVLDSACQLFISMQASCQKSDVAVYTTAHYKPGHLYDGVSSSKGSRLSFLRVYKVVCTSLCMHLLKAGRVDEAHELFRDTAKTDSDIFLYAYNTAIHRLGKKGDIDKAWELFQSMSVHGCKPDVVTYNTLVSSLGKSRQVDKACDLFLDMQVLGFKPDVVTCTTLVDVLCKSGRVQSALDLFEEMHVQGISPNVFTYHSLLHGLCKAGQLSRAYMLYEEMINKQCSPNEVMYRSLIRHFSSDSHLVNYLYHLYTDMSEKGYSLDRLTSYMLIKSLRAAGKADEALHVVSRSPRKGKV